MAALILLVFYTRGGCLLRWLAGGIIVSNGKKKLTREVSNQFLGVKPQWQVQDPAAGFGREGATRAAG
jgi:hypothetical protein